MTVIRRVFDLETRTLKGKERCYVGQPNDHLSTRIEFDYNPINAITTMGYVPYIMFNIMDDWGQPIVYGPGSSPAFDGKSFEIPYEVMSRVKTSRLEYQLWLVRDNKSWTGDRYQLEANGAEYLHSGIDGFAVKGGIRCRGPSDPCRPVTPCVDPSLMQWLTFFQKQFIMAPVQESYGLLSDGVTQGVQIYFPKYIENEGKEIIELAVPFLEEDGKLDTSKYLSVLDSWPEVIQDQDLVSARLMHESLSYKTDKWMAIPEWDPTVSYEVGSTVMYKDGDFAPNVYLSKGYDNINHNPAEDSEWWSTVTEQERVVVSWENVDDDTIPSSRLVDDEFSLHAIREWKPDISYVVGSTVVFHNNIYISISGNNLNEIPIVVDPETGLANLNDQYWSRVSGDVDVSEVPTSTEVFPLAYSVDLSNIHGDESEHRVVKRTDIPGYVAFDLHHPFNTRSLFVQVKRNTGNHEFVDCIIETPERNVVRLKFDKILESDHPGYIETLEAIVTPGGGRDEAYVMEDFVDKEMFAAEKGRTIATLDEDGFITDSQVHIGSLVTPDPSPDMLANVIDLQTVNSEVKRVNANLTSQLNVYDSRKTERTEFGPWNSQANYLVDAVVSWKGGIFIATAKNSGVDPSTDTTGTWKSTRFNDTEIMRFSASFGSQDVSEYTITHPLDTKDFVYAIRRVRDGRYMKEADIYAVGFDSVRVVIPEGIDAEPMVLNMYGCKRSGSDLPAVGIQSVTEPSNTWILDNPTGSPLFVQAFDSEGQLQYADVQQDPSMSYDPVTVGLYKEDTGTLIYAPASRTFDFTRSDLVEENGGYDLKMNKADLLSTSESGEKWYLIQAYLGQEGQLMADYGQTTYEVTVGFDKDTIDSLPEGWVGTLVLVEGTAIPVNGTSWSMPADRPIAVQVYAEEGLLFGDAGYDSEAGTMSVAFSETVNGTVVVI